MPGGGGGGPPAGGGGGDPGWGQDPYLHGGWGSSLAPDRRRIAPETYWAIRRSSQNCRAYFSAHYTGSRRGRSWQDLWLTCEMVDLEVDKAYTASGLEGVHFALATSDTLEHMLARLGAEIAYLQYRDEGMYQLLLTSKPPGESDILPSWALDVARDQSKALWLQAGRVAGGRGAAAGARPAAGAHSGDDGEDGAGRRRRRPKAKARASADSAAGGGGARAL